MGVLWSKSDRRSETTSSVDDGTGASHISAGAYSTGPKSASGIPEGSALLHTNFCEAAAAEESKSRSFESLNALVDGPSHEGCSVELAVGACAAPLTDAASEAATQAVRVAAMETAARVGKRSRSVCDLSDRAIALCTRDAIVAVHQRALSLGIVDQQISQEALMRALGSASCDARGMAAMPPPTPLPPPPTTPAPLPPSTTPPSSLSPSTPLQSGSTHAQNLLSAPNSQLSPLATYLPTYPAAHAWAQGGSACPCSMHGIGHCLLQEGGLQPSLTTAPTAFASAATTADADADTATASPWELQPSSKRQRVSQHCGSVIPWAAPSGAISAARDEPPPLSPLSLARLERSPLYRMLYSPITALLHENALRRHATSQACSIVDVLRVQELAQRIFLLVPMSSRGAFARVCRDWSDVAKHCWSADGFAKVETEVVLRVRERGMPVAQVTSWVRTNQIRPIFSMLVLCENGFLEQLRVCRRLPNDPVSGARGGNSDTEPWVDNRKGWRLEESVPESARSCVSAQFVVTKHHAYCVVAVRGQALLVKLGGQSSGSHEHMYTDRFPDRVSSMAMCPQDNNIIAFGVPLPRATPHLLAAAGAEPTYTAAVGSPDSASTGLSVSRSSTIEVINFAQSSKLQVLRTKHKEDILKVDYSPESSCLVSVSADCVQLWRTGEPSAPVTGVVETEPLTTLELPLGVRVRIAKVHPDWKSILVATGEAIEVRSLNGAVDPSRRSDAATISALLSLLWRRENMQVTAAAIIEHGTKLAVSDRGDRLLILNYNGLEPVKTFDLPWGYLQQPPSPTISARRVCTVTAISECPDVNLHQGDWRDGGLITVASSRGEVMLLKVA